MPADTLRMWNGTRASALCQFLVKNYFDPRAIVLSDIDGIVVDSERCTIDSYVKALSMHGIKLPCKIVREAVWGYTWERAAEALRLEPELAARVHDTKLSMPIDCDLIKPMISNLRQSGRHLVFVTSGSARGAAAKLDKCRFTEEPCFYSCPKHLQSWWRSAVPYNLRQRVVLIDDARAVVDAAKLSGIRALHYENGILSNA